MPAKTDNLRICNTQPLVTPAALAEELPLPESSAAFIQRSRQTVEDILAGRDRRLLVVVGPCSIHDPDPALDYAAQLKAASTDTEDALFLVIVGD